MEFLFKRYFRIVVIWKLRRNTSNNIPDKFIKQNHNKKRIFHMWDSWSDPTNEDTQSKYFDSYQKSCSLWIRTRGIQNWSHLWPCDQFGRKWCHQNPSHSLPSITRNIITHQTRLNKTTYESKNILSGHQFFWSIQETHIIDELASFHTCFLCTFLKYGIVGRYFTSIVLKGRSIHAVSKNFYSIAFEHDCYVSLKWYTESN